MAEKQIKLNVNKDNALALVASGNLKDARDVFFELCNMDNSDVESWFYLGNINGQLGRFDDAEYAFQHIVDLNENNPNALYGLAASQHQLGKYSDSIVNFKQSITLMPGNWQCHFCLGNVYKDNNDLDLAIKSYNMALALNPDQPELLNNLANTYVLTSDYTASLVIYEKIIKLAPTYADGYANLAQVLYKIGRHFQSIDCYKKAISLKNDAFFYYRLAIVYQDDQFLLEAEEALRNAIKIKSDVKEFYLRLARVLAMQSRLDDSIEVLKSIPGQTCDSEIVKIGMADSYEVNGVYDKAIEILQPLVQGESTNARAPILFGKLASKHKCYDLAIDSLLEVLSRDGLNKNIEQNVNYVLGGVYDRIESYDNAFKHYKMANDAPNIKYDNNGVTQEYDQYIAQFSREALNNFVSSTNNSKLPVFIVGMPRSGTSLVEQIISSHSEIYGAGELEDIQEIVISMTTAGQANGRLLDFESADLDKISNEYIESLKSDFGNAKRVINKMPHNFKYLGLIQLLFPESKIIHCVRNPLDTCLSCYFQDFGVKHPYSLTLKGLAEHYIEYRRLMKHWNAVLKQPVFEVSYEDLVVNQEKVSRDLIRYCDLEWQDDCLTFHKSQRLVTTSSYDQVRQPMYNKSVSRWHNYRDQLKPIISLFESEGISY